MAEGDLVYLVSDVVDQLDLSAMYAFLDRSELHFQMLKVSKRYRQFIAQQLDQLEQKQYTSQAIENMWNAMDAYQDGYVANLPWAIISFLQGRSVTTGFPSQHARL